jgi:hypothetical protein
MIVNEGEIQICGVVKANIPFQKIILFQNNITITDATVYANLTLATFSGYASVTPSWGTPAIDGSGKASMTATAVVFAHNGGGTANTIYGWAWINDDAITKKIVSAKLLTTPKSMSVSGDSLTVTLTFRDYQP